MLKTLQILHLTLAVCFFYDCFIYLLLIEIIKVQFIKNTHYHHQKEKSTHCHVQFHQKEKKTTTTTTATLTDSFYGCKKYVSKQDLIYQYCFTKGSVRAIFGGEKRDFELVVFKETIKE